MTRARQQMDYLLAVLAAVALMLLAGMMALQYDQLQDSEETVSNGRSMGEWDISQLQVEQLKLRSEINAALREQGTATSMARLALRHGIFMSRYDLVRDTLGQREADSLPGLKPLLDQLARVSAQTERYFGPDGTTPPFDETQLRRIATLIDSTADPIQTVLLSSNHARLLATTQYQAAVRAQVRSAWAICVALLAVASTFAVLALRQKRLAVRRAQALEQLHAEVSHRATHDSLTGLINRDEFERLLAEALQEDASDQAAHAVLFIDLDRFKVVNDTCGHSGGDQLLREVARLIRGVVRDAGTIARNSGDEFAVVLQRCDRQGALRLAEQICQSIDRFRFVHAGQSFHIGASVGLVMLGRWHSVTAVMQAADSACCIAKESGRNRVYVYQDSDLGVQAQRGITHWVQRLHAALDENRLQLYWQRIVALQSSAEGPVRGEVLLRLREGSTLIEPGAFLPVAERYALVSRIDRWVVAEVFAQLAAAGPPLAALETLSVNLSGQSVSDPEFQQFMLGHLQAPGFDLRKLCIEVTETSAITHLREVIAFFETLRGFGVRVSLDDFGSGMSSFTYLKNLPVDCLKIDGQFMRQLGSDAYDQATVRAICAVAHATGKQTVAEGIETEEVAAMLRAFGVDYGQGFLWHAPAPLATLLEPSAAARLRGATSEAPTLRA